MTSERAPPPWTKKRSSMDEMRRPSSLDEDDDEGLGILGTTRTTGREIQGDIIVKFNNISFRCQVPRVLMGWRISCDKSERCGIPRRR